MENTVVATTGFSQEHVSVEWKILNFDNIHTDAKLVEQQQLEVSVPQGSNACATKWKIFCFPKENGIGVYHKLIFCEQEGIDVYSCLRICIKTLKDDGTERTYFDFKTPMKLMPCGADWDWGFKVITSEELAKGVPLVNGCLTLNLRLEVWTMKGAGVVEPHNSLSSKQKEQRAAKLMRDLSLFENSKELSDIKILSMEGNEHLANKTILSVRSPVFARMFKANLNEAVTGVVKLEDISSRTLVIILHYIYTGEISLEDFTTTSDIIDVVYAAEKYELDELRECCDEIMSTKWNALNAAEVLEAARKFRLTKTELQLSKHVMQ